jgi:hypothetical protein
VSYPLLPSCSLGETADSDDFLSSLSPLPLRNLPSSRSVHIFNMEDEDETLAPFIPNQQPPPTSSEFDSFSPSSNSKSTKLPQKPAARRASNSPMWNKPDVDWSRTRGTSTSFSFGGLFGGGSKSTYEPIAPMDPNTAFNSPYSDEKNHIELDMDEDLRVGDSNEKVRRRRSTNAITSFVRLPFTALP